MGCFWSNDAEARDRYQYQRRIVNNTNRHRRGQVASAIKPLFGEYRCTCGRNWTSRRSWPNMFQVCKRCGNNVFAHAQRALQRSDTSRDSNGVQEHPQELCQMCQQLGQYCGNIRNIR